MLLARPTVIKGKEPRNAKVVTFYKRTASLVVKMIGIVKPDESFVADTILYLLVFRPVVTYAFAIAARLRRTRVCQNAHRSDSGTLRRRREPRSETGPSSLWRTRIAPFFDLRASRVVLAFQQKREVKRHVASDAAPDRGPRPDVASDATSSSFFEFPRRNVGQRRRRGDVVPPSSFVREAFGTAVPGFVLGRRRVRTRRDRPEVWG